MKQRRSQCILLAPRKLLSPMPTPGAMRRCRPRVGVLPPTSAKRQLFGRKDHARDDRCARHSVKRSPAAGRRNRRSSAESRAASRPHRTVNALSCASAVKNTNAALKLQNDLSFVAYFALLTFFTGPSGGPTCWRFFSPAPGAFSVCQLCEAIGRWILMYSASY